MGYETLDKIKKKVVSLQKNIKYEEMEVLSVHLIDPKVKLLLFNLEKMNLIRITKKPALSEILRKLRKYENEIPSFDEITKEVESVRQKQYEKKKERKYNHRTIANS